MMEMIEANWLLILLALALGVLIAWYVFHASRKTRITGDGAGDRRDVLDEGAARAARNQALIDSPASGAPPRDGGTVVPPATPAGLAGAGEAISASSEKAQAEAVRAEDAQTGDVPAPEQDGDDLTRLKGVGPKLAAQLRDIGVTTFAEISGWSDADIDRIDAQLGRFQGRIRRDSWVEQAGYLARGDTAGFAAKYGSVG